MAAQLGQLSPGQMTILALFGAVVYMTGEAVARRRAANEETPRGNPRSQLIQNPDPQWFVNAELFGCRCTAEQSYQYWTAQGVVETKASPQQYAQNGATQFIGLKCLTGKAPAPSASINKDT